MSNSKRLSLDMFKEKNVGLEVNTSEQGQEAGASTWVCGTLALSAILLATGHNGCGSNDCH